eukprot:Phypoly_transcript_16595.p1 GENE.Phypoly_transcript_16595~~Phypoly_transcript_16595.p1  ORF type:complete len:281 (-),score=55.09 Phypoly_transcript_16595:12-782(-)
MRKPKIAPTHKPEPQPPKITLPLPIPKAPKWEGWKIPSPPPLPVPEIITQNSQISQLPPISQISQFSQIPQLSPLPFVPQISPVPQIPQFSQISHAPLNPHSPPFQHFACELPKMDIAQFPNMDCDCDMVCQSKVIQPPLAKSPMISAKEVREATETIVRAIKSLTLASASPSLFPSALCPPPHLSDVHAAVLDSLHTLSRECDSLLHDSTCKMDQVCCEEECCPSACPLEEECTCTYHTNCFSLPMIIDSKIWHM